MEPRQIFRLNNEVSIMRATAGHPHIISIREVFYSSNFVYLIMDLCCGGELFNLVSPNDGPWSTEDEIACMLCDMFGVISFLHGKGIVHRDIKLENWMLSKAGNKSSLKLIDFGLSKLLGEEEKMSQPVGSAYYVAPEVLLGSYDQSCDLWSMGVICYMMLSATSPFHGKNDIEVRSKIIEGKYEMPPEYFGKVSPEARDFISKLLVKDTETRMTAEQALIHPFLKSCKRSCSSGASSLRRSDLLSTLRTFCQFSNLKRFVLNIATQTYDFTDLAGGLIESFRIISGNKFVMSSADLAKALQGYATQTEIEEIFKVLNSWGDESLSLSEFVAATLWQKIRLTDEHLKGIFQVIDVEGRGFLTLEDLGRVLGKNASPSETEEILAEAYFENPAGRVYFSGFLRFWREVGESKGQRSGRTFFKKFQVGFHKRNANIFSKR
mmetsp:Transcript_14802/g.22045  ORF Transcript_14802/g.22045 Transcript_14802/m.22045 type:complete len:438 (+) Transcript_14802:459-1772(+)